MCVCVSTQVGNWVATTILSFEDIPPDKDDFLASVIKITHNGLWGKLLQKTPDTRIRVAESRQDFVYQYTQGNVVGLLVAKIH